MLNKLHHIAKTIHGQHRASSGMYPYNQQSLKPAPNMQPQSGADEYPRPDFQRTNLRWTSLNGPWDFYFDDEDIGLSQQWQRYGLPDQNKRTIQVPFVFQAPASGINIREKHEVSRRCQ